MKKKSLKIYIFSLWWMQTFISRIRNYVSFCDCPSKQIISEMGADLLPGTSYPEKIDSPRYWTKERLTHRGYITEPIFLVQQEVLYSGILYSGVLYPSEPSISSSSSMKSEAKSEIFQPVDQWRRWVRMMKKKLDVKISFVCPFNTKIVFNF